MSKLVAFAAIQGGYKVVSSAEGQLRQILSEMNADTKVEFPIPGIFLPVICSLTGMKVETLEDLKNPEFARGLLPPHVKGKNHLPYLGPLLDAGMAAIFAYEILEAIRIVRQPDFYIAQKIRIWKPVKNGWVRQTTLSSENAVLTSGTVLPWVRCHRWRSPHAEIAKMIVRLPETESLHLLRSQPQRDLCY
ncbi:MAG: hypothetical protein R2861_14475 [Desulfobacterales bacterium]